MATTSSLFLRSRRNCSWVKTCLALSLVMAVLNGCETFKTRSEVEEAKPPAKHSSISQIHEPTHDTLHEPQPVVTPPSAPQSPSTPTAPPTPTFLNKELPKVGLILGPGGMKAYAEIGVLREFARARIPVHAVVGLEWGAVIGALYAQQGQVNEAEWKSFKLKSQDLPEENGFLSSSIKPQSIASLTGFLDTIFGDAQIERGKIDFACPAYWSRADRFGWMSHGRVNEAMRACVPYPPLYHDNAGVLASPFSTEAAAAYLRTRGCNLIIAVNVLGQGDYLPAKVASQEPTDALLWNEIARSMSRTHAGDVNTIITVPTGGHPITDFNGRRALMDAGVKAANPVVNGLSQQYGF